MRELTVARVCEVVVGLHRAVGSGQPGVEPALYPEALLAKIEVQHVQLRRRHAVHQRPKKGRRVEPPAGIHEKAAVRERGPVLQREGRRRPTALEQLQQRLQRVRHPVRRRRAAIDDALPLPRQAVAVVRAQAERIVRAVDG